jgi:lipoprotein NlpD
VALALDGCASRGSRASGEVQRAPASGVHVVRPGETLYGIATRYGLDYHDLARWNRLDDAARIYPGQHLVLFAPTNPSGADVTGKPAPPDPDLTPPPSAWQWPTNGTVAVGYGQSMRTASGIQVGGELGQSVRAAADGEVVYAGSGLAGYGQLLIVRHNAAWLSAYGYCQQLLVVEGQRVVAGQEIARMGEGPGRQAALHFEIRRNGAPVDPLRFLPARAPAAR